MPYCETASKPDFHTSVTSQAFVACRRQERKAETALPPTRARRQQNSALVPGLASIARETSEAVGTCCLKLQDDGAGITRSPDKMRSLGGVGAIASQLMDVWGRRAIVPCRIHTPNDASVSRSVSKETGSRRQESCRS